MRLFWLAFLLLTVTLPSFAANFTVFYLSRPIEDYYGYSLQRVCDERTTQDYVTVSLKSTQTDPPSALAIDVRAGKVFWGGDSAIYEENLNDTLSTPTRVWSDPSLNGTVKKIVLGKNDDSMWASFGNDLVMWNRTTGSIGYLLRNSSLNGIFAIDWNYNNLFFLQILMELIDWLFQI